MAVEGIVRADARGRIAVGRYIEDIEGRYFRIVRLADGSLTVTEVTK